MKQLAVLMVSLGILATGLTAAPPPAEAQMQLSQARLNGYCRDSNTMRRLGLARAYYQGSKIGLDYWGSPLLECYYAIRGRKPVHRTSPTIVCRYYGRSGQWFRRGFTFFCR